MTTVYRSDDLGAPTLTRELNSFSDLLQAALVDGYGSKVGAGWTTIYTDIGKKVFYNGSVYLRVDDSALVSGRYGLAYMNLFETVSSIDLGTGPCPSTSSDSTIQNNQAWFEYYGTSTSVSTVALPWIIIADAETCYVSISSNITDTGSTGVPDFFKASSYTSDVYVTMFGSFESYLNSDGYASFIACFNQQGGSSAPTTITRWQAIPGQLITTYCWMLRGADRTTNGKKNYIILSETTVVSTADPGLEAAQNAAIRNDLTIDYTADFHSQYLYRPVFLTEYITTNQYVIRGKLPWVYNGPFSSYVNNYAGESLIVDGVNLVGIRVDSGGGFWVEV